MSTEDDAQWLSETFGWDLSQALDFVRDIEARTRRECADKTYSFAPERGDA